MDKTSKERRGKFLILFWFFILLALAAAASLVNTAGLIAAGTYGSLLLIFILSAGFVIAWILARRGIKIPVLASVIVLACLSIATLAFVGMTVRKVASTVQEANIQKIVSEDISFTTFDGKYHTLADYQGSIVVLGFWGSWCDNCEDQMKDLERLWLEYRDRGVVVLGLTYLDTQEASLVSMTEWGLTYPVGADTGYKVSNILGVEDVPEVYIFGRDNLLAASIHQQISYQDLLPILQQVLGE